MHIDLKTTSATPPTQPDETPPSTPQEPCESGPCDVPAPHDQQNYYNQWQALVSGK